jgi:large subunit ribosomal protein L10
MAVSRADKAAELGELETTFREVDTAVLVDFRGITVPQVTELRRQIRAAGGTYRVVKNTLSGVRRSRRSPRCSWARRPS